jgi:hypothetical protein
VASKSAQPEPEKAELIEEALDALDDALDRLKVLYEQYFLGIQKQPPQFVHIEVERKLRDLAQLNIRNTALRYRFVTLQQKFGSYNTYWRRTLREIEAGRYIRSLSKITRQAAATGAEIPYEILAAMPRRMREQVRRDREAALALQRRRRGLPDDAGAAALDEAALLTLVPSEGDGDGDGDDDEGDGEGFIRESTDVREQALRARGGAHVVDESDAELDLDAFFREVEAGEAAAAAAPAAPRPATISPPKVPPIAPSQQARPNPIAPGSSRALPPVSAEVMTGPFPRAAPPATPPRPLPPIATPPRPRPPIPPGPSATATPPTTSPTVTPPTLTPPKPSPTVPPPPTTPRPSATVTPPKPPPIVPPPRATPPIALSPKPPAAAAPPSSPPAVAHSPAPDAKPMAPPGMSESDVNALYAKYVKAKETIGQTPNPGSFNRLMRNIHAQTPKIMEQYQAKGVDFTVSIQDNQVIIRAKPKL